MTAIKPKPGVRKATSLLLFLLVVGFGGSLIAAFDFGQLTIRSLVNILFATAVVAIVATAVILEDKRARSVELTTEAATSLVWTRTPGLVPFRLMPMTIRWEDLRQIAHKGLVVGLRDARGEISVNSYLFDSPDEVLAFINQCAAKAQKGGSADSELRS
jgi:hypothetical protein